MPILDVHVELNRFYDNWVRLDAVGREQLASRRDACLQRLRDGLQLLGAKNGMNYRPFERRINQGSYAMHTINQHRDMQYDIDVALIFDANDLPTKALEARRRVANALLLAGGNFKFSPEPRTNAVTVWYADGTHVDLAIYRRVASWFSERLEHAGSVWGARDPEAVTTWFNEQVSSLSPQYLNPTVAPSQLRRIVQLVKSFSKARDSKGGSRSMPGGMVLTTLVVEAYKKDRNGDDISLFETLVALQKRLGRSLDVTCPVGPSVSMTATPTAKAKLKRFAAALDRSLQSLATADRTATTRRKVLQAWGRFFKHPAWSDVDF